VQPEEYAGSRRERNRFVHGEAAGAPIDRLRRLRRSSILILAGFTVGILPWTAYLAQTLPSRHVVRHWDIAWVGLDLIEAVAALATVVALLRSSPLLATVAATTGTLLVCDAWFDVVTAHPGSEFRATVATAALGELPLAVLCFWLAHDAERLAMRRAPT
jgi:hypothetical protein